MIHKSKKMHGVAPAILELAGIEVPEGVDGRSLVSLLDGK